MDKITIFWFRQDLRLVDNPGLYQAAKNGLVLPIYIQDDASQGEFKVGAAARWWLHHSLDKLNISLDGMLNIYVGEAKNIIQKLVEQYSVRTVYWNRSYEPWRIRDDSAIKAMLKDINIDCKSFNGSLLWEPWEILKKDDTPYKVFTPFYRRGCLESKPPRVPLPAPENIELFKDQSNHTILENLNLLPSNPWHKTMDLTWKIGEQAAKNRLTEFLKRGLQGYKEGRNFPILKNVSRLSPHLHFGEISPNQVWHAAQTKFPIENFEKDLDHFLSELGWREFSHYLLYHFPSLHTENFQEKFNLFPWQENATYLKAWQAGETGYPIVDAGMRELWLTGYMHNRVRMIVGSFLVKNLLIHWRHGRDWFWDCLVDADLANNSAGWQWIAGSGADAAPYFRIFNPITQGEKFDPQGEYTRKFVPEISQLPDQYLYKPWEAPEHVLKKAGIILGKTYPRPIVSLEDSRNMALEAFKCMKER